MHVFLFRQTSQEDNYAEMLAKTWHQTDDWGTPQRVLLHAPIGNVCLCAT